MYQATQSFIDELNKYSRKFSARITVGEDVLTEEIKKATFTFGSCGADTFTIGSVFASYVDMTLSAVDVSLAEKEMQVEIGLNLPDGTVEYVPMGYFTAAPADIAKSRDSVTLKASDRISTKCGGLYVPSVTFPATIGAVISDVEKQTGITVKTTLPTTGVIQTAMEGLLYRDALGYIAGLLGGFVYANRNGEICIAAYPTTAAVEVPADRFWSVETGEGEYAVNSLTVVVSEGGEDADGNEVQGVSFTDGSGTGVSVSNPYMTADLFAAMKGRVIGYSFSSGTVRMLGDPRLDPADAITAYNDAGQSFLLPCMNLVMEYDGGLATTIATPGLAASDESVQGPLTQQVERLATDMVLAKEVIAKKITAEQAELKFATIEKANILEAEIAKVSGEFATFKSGEFEELKVAHAEFESQTVDDFSAVNAQIQMISGDLASYKTVVADELVAAKGWMLEGAIGSAQISSVDAGKIKSGTLDTALVTVAGTDGRLQIADNTISISDANRVRVQVGKDASGDYTLAVWDATGNLIWDALGATENTIQRAIIRDKMVADDAAIKALKIDLQSFNTALTEQGVTISGTVVQVGDKTLNVALTEQTQLLTNQGETLSDHATKIEANEKAISLKVSSQDFESYKTTVNGEISSAQSRLSASESSITAMQGQIALKVEQTDIDTAVQGIEVGGRNLLPTTETYADWSKPASSNVSISDGIVTCTTDKTWRKLTTYVIGYDWNNLVGIEHTVSFEIQTDILAKYPNDYFAIQIFSTSSPHNSNSYSEDNSVFKFLFLSDSKLKKTSFGDWTRISYTFTENRVKPEDHNYVAFYFAFSTDKVADAAISVRRFKLEKGNKPTDWTPAPEDVDADIAAVNDRFASYSTTTQMNAAITAAKDSITSSVSQTYAKKSELTTVSGKVTTLETWKSEASQKITKDGIISTVGTYYATSTEVDAATSRITSVEQTAAGLAVKIDEVGQAASDAAKTATNFLSYDSTNGLQIGNKQSGSWSGYRTRISPNDFAILDTNGNTLASYGAQYIYLGKNSSDSVIDLCNGAGTIRQYVDEEIDNNYKSLSIDGTDGMYLSANNTIRLDAWCEYNGVNRGAIINIISGTPWNDDLNASMPSGEIYFGACNEDTNGTTLGESYIVLSSDSIFMNAGENSTFSVQTDPSRIDMVADDVYCSTRLHVGSVIFGGNKTGYVDGKTGYYINCEGYMHLQRSTGNPYICFYYGEGTTTGGSIGMTSTTNMQFSGASSFTFNNTVYAERRKGGYWLTNKHYSGSTGCSFKLLNGTNTSAGESTTEVFLSGGGDSTSVYLRSYPVYARTYSSAANVYITSSGIFGRSTSSSIRYKHDVVYYSNEGNGTQQGQIPYEEIDALSLLDLPIVTYKYNDGYVTGEADFDYNKPIVGFIAEDVAAICPDCASYISGDAGKVAESWDERQMIPRMLYIDQYQEKEIQKLKRQVEELMNKCAMLEANQALWQQTA